MLTSSKVQELLLSFNQKRILVIGDVILDRFVYGAVSRYSPEYSTCPILNFTNEITMLGGAANVAANLKGLGAKEVALLGIVGYDANGEHVQELLNSLKVKSALHRSPYPTITKTRFVHGSRHLLRFDVESSLAFHDLFYRDLESFSYVDGIIIQDYAKGAFCGSTVHAIMQFARGHNIPVFVDPKKEHWHKFQGAALVKPNFKEAQTALGRASEVSLGVMAKDIRSLTGAKMAIVTAGSRGMFLSPAAADIWALPNRVEVVDVSGAGDTAISVLSLAFLSGASKVEALSLANLASGIVIEKNGTAVVTAEELIARIK